jgi:hypothetical protein
MTSMTAWSGTPRSASFAGLDTIERETVVRYRWWQAAGLESAAEALFPAELPRLLRERTGSPDSPWSSVSRIAVGCSHGRFRNLK